MGKNPARGAADHRGRPVIDVPHDPYARWVRDHDTLTDEDREEAHRLLEADSPAVEPNYPGVVYLPDGRVIQAPSSPSDPVPAAVGEYAETAQSY